EASRKDGANVHLIDGSVQLDPGISACKGIGILREQLREIGILKIADPIRHTKMTQVCNRKNAASTQLRESHVGEGPVVSPRPQEHPMQGNAITQKANAEFLHTVEIHRPLLVMAALFHFVDALATVLYRGTAVLNPRRKHECRCHVSISH